MSNFEEKSLEAANTVYTLGLDLGTNSIGYAILGLDKDTLEPTHIIKTGSRIFDNGTSPKTGESLAVKRRLARSARRNRERTQRRQQKFINALKQAEMLPAENEAFRNLENLNPYKLRSDGLDRQLQLHHLGRALYQLAQRRGYRSNAQLDAEQAADAKEKGATKKAISEFYRQLEDTDCRTVGEFFYKECLQKKRPIRLRSSKAEDSRGIEFELFVERKMIEEEFKLLWETQKEFYKNTKRAHVFSEENYRKLYEIVFYQRPLKSQETGYCHFFPSERRAKDSHPLVSQIKMWDRLNNLRYTNLLTGETNLPITIPQRNLMVDYMSGRLDKKGNPSNKPALAESSYPALREVLFGKKDKDNYVFKQELFDKDDKPLNNKLKGDIVEAAFTQTELTRNFWTKAGLNQKTTAINLIETTFDDEIVALLKQELNVDEDTAKALAAVKIPSGYADVSLKAYNILKTYVLREDDIVSYSAALKYGKANNQLVSQAARGTSVDKLPNYSDVLLEYVTPVKSGLETQNRISNPVVHVVLNQLRLVVNEIIDFMGTKPYSINLELTTDLKRSEKQKQQIQKQQNLNRKLNEALNDELTGLNVEANSTNREKLKLFKEIAATNNGVARCVYSGKTIGYAQLFNGEVEVDHILPYSITFDDHISNKVLALRKYNLKKGNKSPYEHFSSNKEEWENILSRIEDLPKNKKAKFEEDALKVYRERKAGFLARQLTDTAYISRAAYKYLEVLFERKERKEKLRVISGQATSQIRAAWGLNTILNKEKENTKNRDDHRHHAIDAVVIALTTPTLINAATYVYQTGERIEGEIFPMPYRNLHQDATAAISKTITSHKVDHGIQGQLHQETALKIVNRREVFETQATPIQATTKKVDGKKEHKEQPVNNAIIMTNKDGSLGNIYQSGSNYCYEIFETENGKWDGNIITTFTANTKEYQHHLKHNKKTCFETQTPLVRRIRKKDVVYFDGSGKSGLQGYYIIVRISDGDIGFTPIDSASSVLQRLSPNILRQEKPNFVHITPAGNVLS